jgi:hypothetical protein
VGAAAAASPAYVFDPTLGVAGSLTLLAETLRQPAAPTHARLDALSRLAQALKAVPPGSEDHAAVPVDVLVPAYARTHTSICMRTRLGVLWLSACIWPTDALAHT